MSNKIIVASVAGVGGLAIVNSVVAHKGITRIVAGAYVLLLLLSLLDLFGGVWSQIAGGLALLALVSSVLLNVNTFTALGKVVGSSGSSGGEPSNKVLPGTLPTVPATPRGVS